MLDADLAMLYGVEVRILNQGVARNRKRFPSDFMFRLSAKEYQNLRSQIVTISGEEKANSTPTGCWENEREREVNEKSNIEHSISSGGAVCVGSGLRNDHHDHNY